MIKLIKLIIKDTITLYLPIAIIIPILILSVFIVGAILNIELKVTLMQALSDYFIYGDLFGITAWRIHLLWLFISLIISTFDNIKNT